MASLLPLGGATLCSSFIHSLPSVTSIPLLNDSRRNWESEHLCLNGLVAKSPF